MGFVQSHDFALIGRFPTAYKANFNLLRQWLPLSDCLPGSRCLHVGPGGFLGLEALLVAGGAGKVTAVDKFSFGINYPEISNQIPSYREAKDFLYKLAVEQGDIFLSPEKFEKIFTDDQRTSLNQDLLAYRYPVDVEELPFDDNSFDLVCSFAVLEHVRRPDRAVRELARVTRTGGINLHRIMTVDHRFFSNISGFNQFSFRRHSSSEWEDITREKFYQNRLLPGQWRQLFEEAGCNTLRYEEESHTPMSDKEIKNFHPEFHGFTPAVNGH